MAKQPGYLFAFHADAFLRYIQRERGLSRNTAEAWKRALVTWEEFCLRTGLEPLSGDRDALTAYLEDARSRLSPATVAQRLGGLRAFFRYLVAEGIIESDPTIHIRNVSQPKPIPKAIPLEDVERLLGVPDDSLTGIRDRAILELLYGSAMRVSELAALDMGDVDISDRTVHIRAGKGSKARKVPIGRSADAVRTYVVRVSAHADRSR